MWWPEKDRLAPPGGWVNQCSSSARIVLALARWLLSRELCSLNSVFMAVKVALVFQGKEFKFLQANTKLIPAQGLVTNVLYYTTCVYLCVLNLIQPKTCSLLHLLSELVLKSGPAKKFSFTSSVFLSLIQLKMFSIIPPVLLVLKKVHFVPLVHTLVQPRNYSQLSLHYYQFSASCVFLIPNR